ncbi:glycosyltransferase family 4 protein [Arvimicrobium flavum]|uniref:glycosyltransferase family 4 protein n=1 Tax=Arvimicrobium flavum TaxID=3393320 RepID=UPI00237A470A|nr:glycosyltransferase family 4 protein [Mesorhizobium shangrilense]
MSPAQIDAVTAPAQFPASSSERRPRIAVIASLTSSLVNFRLELLRGLVQRGCEVHAFAPEDDRETIERLRALGVGFTRIPMSRTSARPTEDLATLLALVRGFRAFRPDIVLPYTMKPIIYGGIAARLTGTPHRFALVTGLGYVFIDRTRSLRAAALRWLSVRLYRTALRGVERVFVYNEADAAELHAHGIVADELVSRVPGSGVDTTHFAASPPPAGPPVFLMVARLLRDKGVAEYVAAAKLLRARHPQARFQLLGPFDPNPAAISRAEVDAWVRDGAIEYLGQTKDVRPYLAACSVFVLPSYREGMSRTILEAMATGRAVVTSDGPGCAEPVAHGLTGFVAPVRNSEALAAAMETFVIDPSLISDMGAAGRRRVEENYDVRVINRVLFAGMRLDQTMAELEALSASGRARTA